MRPAAPRLPNADRLCEAIGRTPSNCRALPAGSKALPCLVAPLPAVALARAATSTVSGCAPNFAAQQHWSLEHWRSTRAAELCKPMSCAAWLVRRRCKLAALGGDDAAPEPEWAADCSWRCSSVGRAAHCPAPLNAAELALRCVGWHLRKPHRTAHACSTCSSPGSREASTPSGSVPEGGKAGSTARRRRTRSPAMRRAREEAPRRTAHAIGRAVRQ